MSDKDRFRDFTWWHRLAVVAGIISFGVNLYLSIDGFFRSLRIVSITVRVCVRSAGR